MLFIWWHFHIDMDAGYYFHMATYSDVDINGSISQIIQTNLYGDNLKLSDYLSVYTVLDKHTQVGTIKFHSHMGMIRFENLITPRWELYSSHQGVIILIMTCMEL